MLSLTEMKHESPIDTTSLQLAPSVCVASTFHQVLVKPSELQFVSSPDLSNNQHNCHYAHEVIVINKEFGIYPGPYYFDSLSSFVLPAKTVDTVTRCYLRLPLVWADNFHNVQVEYEITQLDIIATQAANWASALQNTFNRI